MRRVLPLFAVLCLAFAPAPFPKDWGQIDRKTLQGEWVLVGETHATGPPRAKRSVRAVADRGRITFFADDALAGEWAVTLVASEAPKAIDLKRGGDGLRLIRAVYSLKGDTLVLCWNVGHEATRPRSLPGNLPVACQLTFKRKKP